MKKKTKVHLIISSWVEIDHYNEIVECIDKMNLGNIVSRLDVSFKDSNWIKKLESIKKLVNLMKSDQKHENEYQWLTIGSEIKQISGVIDYIISLQSNNHNNNNNNNTNNIKVIELEHNTKYSQPILFDDLIRLENSVGLTKGIFCLIINDFTINVNDMNYEHNQFDLLYENLCKFLFDLIIKQIAIKIQIKFAVGRNESEHLIFHFENKYYKIYLKYFDKNTLMKQLSADGTSKHNKHESNQYYSRL